MHHLFLFKIKFIFSGPLSIMKHAFTARGWGVELCLCVLMSHTMFILVHLDMVYLDV